ncbi:S8 family peptidase, partial [bacterium]|nr:S8 family peptidase [bacterium]
LALGTGAGALASARDAADRAGGRCGLLQAGDSCGGFAVLDVDAAGLRALLAERRPGRILLDRDGVPALVDSRPLIGVDAASTGTLDLGDDWSGTVAILDSGVDTAHGDLGDAPDDDIDGPAPAVGDAADWFDAAGGWPLFAGYKVVGWHDVTDDFPQAAGPWDYHYHGTALASVVAGSGRVDPDYRGVSAGARLTVVKFYDYDQTWHAWAGDFLAACDWLLANHATYRVRTVLMAVNWDVDAGIGAAVAALVDAGLLPVAAAGNQGDDPAGPGYPALLPDVLTVGAVNAAGQVSAFSGRGLAGQGKPDLVAPGGGLLAAGGRIVAADNDPDDTYSGRFGTSLAAAHVAGAAALLDEALRENGLAPAAGRAEVQARQSVLRLATAFVPAAETADGLGSVNLPAYSGHDPARGWGLLRIDAAVDAVLKPLVAGRDDAASFTFDWTGRVAARRLVVCPGVRYLVEAAPAGGLDVSLEVVRIATGDGRAAAPDMLVDQNPAGVSEFAYLTAAPGEWTFLVARSLGGAGTVTLRLREADGFSAAGGVRTLPGVGTGAPSWGRLAPHAGVSLIAPSRVLVDPVARSLNVTDTSGQYRPGWPVFVFPGVSAQGGLTQPMVMDMDGIAGDEIVVAADFGSVYFFDGTGAVKTVDLAFNRRLTQPVGFRTALGGRRVLVVDREGIARTWSWNASVGAAPEPDATATLGHQVPLAPAAGRLGPGTEESLVIAFADGWLGAFDDQLALRPGWPRDLGGTLEAPPLLVDLDEDGQHEVVQPVRDGASGQLVMRVFRGDGTPAAYDGVVVPAPRGGGWLQLGYPVVAGRYDTGELNVALVGLADNGLAGAAARWSLGIGRLYAGGAAAATDLKAWEAAASTAEGVLDLQGAILGTPVVSPPPGAYGTDLAAPFHVQWSEILYGLTELPAGTTGWWQAGVADDPLLQKTPASVGGEEIVPVSHLGAALVPLGDGVELLVETRDASLMVTPRWAGPVSAATWGLARGDQRSSGAYPLQELTTPAPAPAAVLGGLQAFPNPGSTRIRFRAATGVLPGDAQLAVYDLRGRCVRRLAGADAAGVLQWDGRDGGGRRLAAGAYLAVVRTGGERFTTRVLLTR